MMKTKNNKKKKAVRIGIVAATIISVSVAIATRKKWMPYVKLMFDNMNYTPKFVPSEEVPTNVEVRDQMLKAAKKFKKEVFLQSGGKCSVDPTVFGNTAHHGFFTELFCTPEMEEYKDLITKVGERVFGVKALTDGSVITF
jgi:hypothetical protein